MNAETPAVRRGHGLRSKVLIGVAFASLAVLVSLSLKSLSFEILGAFKPAFLGLIALGLALLVALDALSTMVFTWASGVALPLPVALKGACLRVFVNTVTPFGIGGHPFVIGYFKRKGVPAGVGSSTTAIKLMMVSALVLVGGCVGFFLLPEGRQLNQGVRTVFGASIALQATLIFLLLFLMTRPQSAVGALTRLVALFRRTKLSAGVGKLKTQVIHEAWLTRRCFAAYFRRGKLLLALGLLIHAGMYATELLMLWLVFLGLGQTIPLATCLALASLTLLLLSFMPTPGGSGLGESAFVVLFAGIAPLGILGLAVVLWRLFYTYLIALVGLLLSSANPQRHGGRRAVARMPT